MQSEVIEALRERIRAIERRPPRAERVVASGWAEVDRRIGGGFPRGALSELCGGPASGKTAVALSAMARAIEDGALAAYVDGRGELYAPAVSALGVDLERLLIVRPPAPVARRERGRGRELPPGAIDALWAAEALLASGAFAVVAIDVPVPAGAVTRSGASGESLLRRLLGAAERGTAAGLWLAEPGACRAPASIRLEVERGDAGPAIRIPDGRSERAHHAA